MKYDRIKWQDRTEPTINLSGSVGHGGANKWDDVIFIQAAFALLRKANFDNVSTEYATLRSPGSWIMRLPPSSPNSKLEIAVGSYFKSSLTLGSTRLITKVERFITTDLCSRSLCFIRR